LAVPPGEAAHGRKVGQDVEYSADEQALFLRAGSVLIPRRHGPDGSAASPVADGGPLGAVPAADMVERVRFPAADADETAAGEERWPLRTVTILIEDAQSIQRRTQAGAYSLPLLAIPAGDVPGLLAPGGGEAAANIERRSPA